MLGLERLHPQNPNDALLQECVDTKDNFGLDPIAVKLLQTGSSGVKKVINASVALGEFELLTFAQLHLMPNPDDEQNQQRLACLGNLIERLREGRRRPEEIYNIDALVLKQQEWQALQLLAHPVTGITDRNHVA